MIKFKQKAFDYESTTNTQDIDFTLIWGDYKTTEVNFSKKEIAETLGYQVTDNGIFDEQETIGFGCLSVKNFVHIWEEVYFTITELKDFLTIKDLLYTQEEEAELENVAKALTNYYNECYDCFDLERCAQIKSLADKLNLKLNI